MTGSREREAVPRVDVRRRHSMWPYMAAVHLQVRELHADRTLHTLRALHLHVRELRANCFECLGGDRPDRKGAAVRDGTWENGDLRDTIKEYTGIRGWAVSGAVRGGQQSSGRGWGEAATATVVARWQREPLRGHRRHVWPTDKIAPRR